MVVETPDASELGSEDFAHLRVRGVGPDDHLLTARTDHATLRTFRYPYTSSDVAGA